MQRILWVILSSCIHVQALAAQFGAEPALQSAIGDSVRVHGAPFHDPAKGGPVYFSSGHATGPLLSVTDDSLVILVSGQSLTARSADVDSITVNGHLVWINREAMLPQIGDVVRMSVRPWSEAVFVGVLQAGPRDSLCLAPGGPSRRQWRRVDRARRWMAAEPISPRCFSSDSVQRLAVGRLTSAGSGIGVFAGSLVGLAGGLVVGTQVGKHEVPYHYERCSGGGDWVFSGPCGTLVRSTTWRTEYDPAAQVLGAIIGGAVGAILGFLAGRGTREWYEVPVRALVDGWTSMSRPGVAFRIPTQPS